MKGYFRKRGDKWSFTVDVGIDPLTGKRKQITKSGFQTKKEAQEVCAKIINETTEGLYVKPSHLAFYEFIDQWLEYKKTNVRSVTIENYNKLIKNHLIPFFKYKTVQKITYQDISNLYMELSNRLSDRSVSDVHKVLSAALNQAVKWSIIKINPASLVIKPKTSKKQIKVWTKKESQIFLNEIKDHVLYPVFHLALSTGLRQSEILALEWKHIDFSKATLKVVQTLSHDGKTISQMTKTKSGSRMVTLDQTTLQILKSHQDQSKHELVFSSSLGNPILPRNILRVFYSHLKKIDIPKITFHDLRHTHATLLLETGIHPKIVAERLGHSDMRVTLEVYSHVLPNMQKDVAEKINKFFI